MIVKCLVVARYDSNGVEIEPLIIQKPSWKQIKQHIEKLDAFSFPIIRLRLNNYEDPDWEDLEALDIIGGKGKYAIFGQDIDKVGKHLYNPNESEERILVWESDQGYEPTRREILTDIKDVLNITQFYAKKGKFHPKYGWKEIK